MDPRRRKRLLKGQIIVETRPEPGSRTPRVLMSGMLNTPPEDVWALLEDADNYGEIFPRVRCSEIVERNGSSMKIRTVVEMPFPFRDLTFVTDATNTVDAEKSTFRSEWTLVDGDFHANSGSWHVTPFPEAPGRTLVDYEVHIQPKIPLPARLMAIFQQLAVPGLIKGMRKRVRHGAS